jgi:hypothetical protein
MRALIYSLIPDDWISAWRSFRQMLSVANKTPHAFLKHVFGIVIPFLVGSAGAFRYYDSISADFIQGYLTVIGVLSGFVVTLMLFIGSGEGTDVLNYHQSEDYAEKILYLLFSQTLTLACYLLAIILGACWLFSSKAPYPAIHPIYRWLAPLVFGAGFLCVVRTILLPAQIFQRHEFVMAALIDRKQIEHNEAIRRAQEKIGPLNRAG